MKSAKVVETAQLPPQRGEARPPDVTHILIALDDGSVYVMTYVITEYRAGGVPAWTREPTQATVELEIRRAMIANAPRVAKSWRFMTDEEVALAEETHGTFRAAWVERKGRIAVDMDRARALHRDRLRNLREPLLAALDVEHLRALEDGDSAGIKRVVQRKQALRDATKDPAIEAAKTPAELKAVMPRAFRAE